jgi:hypothetical protein
MSPSARLIAPTATARAAARRTTASSPICLPKKRRSLRELLEEGLRR